MNAKKSESEVLEPAMTGEVPIDPFTLADPVEKANPRHDFGQPKRLTRKSRKDGPADIFEFSTELFNELNLQANSLKQWNGKPNGKLADKVILAVCPGNYGVWMKDHGRRKGRSHKNKELAAALDKTPLANLRHLDVSYLGTDDINKYYTIVQDKNFE